MMHTCRYTQTRCIHFKVHSQSRSNMAKHQPIPRHALATLGLHTHTRKKNQQPHTHTVTTFLTTMTRTHTIIHTVTRLGRHFPSSSSWAVFFFSSPLPFFSSICCRLLQAPSTGTQRRLPTRRQTPPSENMYLCLILSMQKSHCRYLSLNICGWIIITHTSSLLVLTQLAARLVLRFTLFRGRRWKSGIPFTSLTWTVPARV